MHEVKKNNILHTYKKINIMLEKWRLQNSDGHQTTQSYSKTNEQCYNNASLDATAYCYAHNCVPILTFKCYADPCEVHFLLTCSPHQSPVLEASSPLSHSYFQQRTPTWSRWHESATPPHHSHHCLEPPGCGWTRLPHTHFVTSLTIVLANGEIKHDKV